MEINWAYILQSINCVAFTMNRNECLKIMYLSPVAVDDHDQLFGESFKDTKEPKVSAEAALYVIKTTAVS